MRDDENRFKKKPNKESNRFSGFMFGTNKQGEGNIKDESHSQEIPEQKEPPYFNRKTNQFDDWILGSRRKEAEHSALTPQNQVEQQIVNLLNKVDVVLLMETVDMLVETTKQYKPLLKGISPKFKQLINKFKS
ncbi:hypothetical protein [Neobacillus cucumis]|uniref:Uncharacterized protein n=1 Tax=Neobacillus cucumis TaxID=1740721 RepID=A0A2N5HA71_9BACI|nr:hypothetical protein [Neobacillus cucumis]PLS02409.1 hypothetical protein CVD27_19840 [Neobacillus cucumis]